MICCNGTLWRSNVQGESNLYCRGLQWIGCSGLCCDERIRKKIVVVDVVGKKGREGGGWIRKYISTAKLISLASPRVASRLQPCSQKERAK